MFPPYGRLDYIQLYVVMMTPIDPKAAFVKYYYIGAGAGPRHLFRAEADAAVDVLPTCRKSADLPVPVGQPEAARGRAALPR